MTVETVAVFAPAKINLTLHVTGLREDGYHLLDSLVVFSPMGDRLTIAPATGLSLTVEGPEAHGVPADMANLALRAAALVAESGGATLTLEKNLPAASGIGGGSADAAAAYRGMLARDRRAPASVYGTDNVGMSQDAERLLALGADIPMCLISAPLRARNIGEQTELLSLPPLPAILVNPRVSVSTADVFRALDTRENPPMPAVLPDFATTAELIGWLATMRNDLEGPAMRLQPVIADVLSDLRATEGCGLARMSGSGATCFALFETADQANAAAAQMYAAHPAWWIAAGLLGDQSRLALPQISSPG